MPSVLRTGPTRASQMVGRQRDEVCAWGTGFLAVAI